ncbi:MAG TPA: LptA/OstA family protein [Acidisphaera sp.]|nr:LptA/OstA family protein [Acidisphaera sp.]
MKPFALARVAVLAAPLAVPGVAAAQQIDLSHGGPIDISAQDGLEWQQATQEIIARGDAHATRGNVTVSADRLIAHYRKKAGPPAGANAATGGTPAPAGAPPAQASPAATPPAPGQDTTGLSLGAAAGGDSSGSNEIYRVEAIGNVRIDTPTDHVTGEHATYDIDQAVMLITGNNLRLTTPSQNLSARDDLEYWSQKHMAVARGDAVLVTSDGRRIAADVLVAYTEEGQPQPAAPAPKPVQTVNATAPAAPAAPAAPLQGDDALAASGKLKKAEAWGHVSVRTATDIVTGDRGVYVPATGIARLAGNVRITRGQNQLNGREAEVNLKTGISRLLAGSEERVTGLVVPSDANAQANGTNAAKPEKPKPGADKP